MHRKMFNYIFYDYKKKKTIYNYFHIIPHPTIENTFQQNN